jgi:nucleoid-associated protein YgaU
MTSNGKIPATDLTTVAVGVQLVHGAANAYRALVAQGAHEHIAIKPAPGVGSGYRDLAVQEEFYDAAHGNAAAARAVQLNTSSSINVAAPGFSSHGWGDRIDLLFDGSQNPTAVDLNLAKRFGFIREFGASDSNHFEHDGKTAIHPPVAAPEPVYYIVQHGDNLTRIAAAHNISLSTIEHLNTQIPNYDLIHPGDKIRVR